MECWWSWNRNRPMLQCLLFCYNGAAFSYRDIWDILIQDRVIKSFHLIFERALVRYGCFYNTQKLENGEKQETNSISKEESISSPLIEFKAYHISCLKPLGPIYTYKVLVSQSLCAYVTFSVPLNCLSPGDKHFSHTGEGEGGQTFLTHRWGQTLFTHRGGTNIFHT